MNGSTKKKKKLKRCWDFILNITNVLLFSYLSVSSVTVGIIFNAWGLVWKLLEAYKLMSLRKEALLSAHSKTVKSLCGCFRSIAFISTSFYPQGLYIYLSYMLGKLR